MSGDHTGPGATQFTRMPRSINAWASEKVKTFGQQVPMQRAAQPDEIAPSYVFFASDELSSYYTGEVLAPIGGETTPG